MNYLIEFTLASGLFALAYMLFFRMETRHDLNRAYLLGSLILSAGLPFLPKVFGVISTPKIFSVLLPTAIVGSTSIEGGVATQTGAWSPLLWIWVVGVVIVLAKSLWGVYQIIRLNSEQVIIEGQRVQITHGDHPPFSFLSNIYISSKNEFHENEMRKIVLHESSHTRLLHGVDLIVLQIFHILCWWNPFIIVYRKLLQETHEYQADAYVIQQEDPVDYSRFLMANANALPRMTLAHHFFTQPLKSRIIMMQKHIRSEHKQYKYLLVLPIVALALFLHSCQEQKEANEVSEPISYEVTRTDTVVTFDPATKEESMQVLESSETIYKVVDEMPRFPGCEDQPDDQKMECSNKNLLNYVYSEVKYPEKAKEDNVEGMVVTTFTVGRNGQVSDITIKQDPGAGMGDEVLRVLNKMASEKIWVPGIHNGKQVNVAFTLPVKFKMS